MVRYCRNFVAALLLAALVTPGVSFAQDVGQAEAERVAALKAEAKAVSRLAKARRNLAKAEKAIADATNAQFASAEAGQVAAVDFRKLAKSPPSFASSRDAREWASKVTASAKRWSDADAQQSKAGKSIERSTRARDKAQAAIVTAQAELDRLPSSSRR
jgi:hypothetical protein